MCRIKSMKNENKSYKVHFSQGTKKVRDVRYTNDSMIQTVPITVCGKDAYDHMGLVFTQKISKVTCKACAKGIAQRMAL